MVAMQVGKEEDPSLWKFSDFPEVNSDWVLGSTHPFILSSLQVTEIKIVFFQLSAKKIIEMCAK